MINQIIDALKKRKDLSGWTVRHVSTHEAQVYAVRQEIESRRLVDSDRYLIDVLRHTSTAEGNPAVGSGNAILLPGGDIDRAIDQAALVAGLVANPVYGLPEPAPLPDVPLCDESLQKDAAAAMLGVMDRIQAAARAHPDVRLTAAECFGQLGSIHLVNSRGIDAQQESTDLEIEFVLIARRGESEAETFHTISRRRLADLDIEGALEKQVSYTLDSLDAVTPASWQGPVVLRGDALTIFLAGDNLNGSVMQTLASAGAKFAKYSSWEVGKPVFRGEVKGDPLTVWANRALPFGAGSNRFDDEGLPAQRVELIRANELTTFAASQRYAEYLKLPATGEFGNIELPPGNTPAADLLAEPYVEVVQFSWFNPDTITGDFATEIRFGYLVENGVRKPFRGGQLVGNYMDALADVRWSAETGFFGGYLGPHTARFNDLRISGPGSA